jgi:hypothetical protein
VNANQQFSTPPGSPTGVSSDGHGQYIDGTNGVCASFDKQGDLLINFACTSASPPRQLGLYPTFLSSVGETNPPCVLPSSIVPGSSPSYTNNILTTPATSPTNTAAFQSMTPDSSGNTVYYISFFIGTAFSGGSQIRLNYHRTASTDFPTDAALASYAQVRRLSATEWVVESVTPSTPNGDPNVAMGVTVASTRHSSTSTECGFYQVPFSFTLDQK